MRHESGPVPFPSGSVVSQVVALLCGVSRWVQLFPPKSELFPGGSWIFGLPQPAAWREKRWWQTGALRFFGCVWARHPDTLAVLCYAGVVRHDSMCA